MTRPASILRPLVRAALAGAVIVALTGCVAQVRKHGYVPSEADLAEIVVGVDTRDTVAETIGTPSSAGLLNDSGYYYVQSMVRTIGPRRPQVVERQLVAISFTDTGVVQNIERFGLEDGRAVVLSRRVTESSVSSQTFIRQLLGNLGNFNAGQLLNE